MDSVEKRLGRLLAYFQCEDDVYWDLLELAKKPLDEENINNIILITKARKSWLTDGEGDPFLEHDEYLEKHIKTDDELNWLIDRKLFEKGKSKE